MSAHQKSKPTKHELREQTHTSDKSQPEESQTRKDSESTLDRRAFLRIGAVATMASVGLATGVKAAHIADLLAASLQGEFDQYDERLLSRQVYHEDFAEPPVDGRDLNGLLNTELDVVFNDEYIREDRFIRKVRTRTYDKRVPGKTLELYPGDTLEVLLKNSLPKNSHSSGGDCPPKDINSPNCLNTTNLHTHGLHVSPEEPGDDIFVEVWPKDDEPHGDHGKHKDGQFRYEMRIPDDHAPGTHWYHAHRHGSTSVQVKNGMAGALIIKEKPGEEILEGAEERILVLQEITNRREEAPGQKQEQVAQRQQPFQMGPMMGMRMMGMRRGQRDDPQDVSITVNGRYQPIIDMQPGEIQRWRIINAGANVATYSKIQLEGHELYLVAWDGITLKKPVAGSPSDSLLLAPGNRADVLVKASNTPGTYEFRRLKFRSGSGMGMMRPRTVPGQVLAQVKVSGDPHDSLQIPTDLPYPKPQNHPYLKPISDEEVRNSPKREITFNVRTMMNIREAQAGYRGPNDEGWDPKPYDPNDSIRVPLGNVEEWTIVNKSSVDHPYHIHVNPFQVVEIKEDGKRPKKFSPEDARWQDVVNVPHNGYVKIRSRFYDFRGKYVLHCHILNHEDRGMMINVEVV